MSAFNTTFGFAGSERLHLPFVVAGRGAALSATAAVGDYLNEVVKGPCDEAGPAFAGAVSGMMFLKE